MATWATRDRAEAAEARLAEAVAILRFHNRTATGMTIRCLPGCIACAFLERNSRTVAKMVANGDAPSVG